MSKRNKRYFAVCVVDFDHIIPASVLEIRTIADSPFPDSVIETPARVTSYKTGQVVELSSASALKAFVRAHAGKFEVCS